MRFAADSLQITARTAGVEASSALDLLPMQRLLITSAVSDLIVVRPADLKNGPDLGLLRPMPVEDFFARPEHHVAIGADVGKGGAEVFQAVRRAHNVGVHDQGHDSGRVRRVG